MKEAKDAGDGYNAATDTYEDLVKAGVIDPTKVVRSALQNASSIASLLLTTEAMVSEIPEEKKESAGARRRHGWRRRHGRNVLKGKAQGQRHKANGQEHKGSAGSNPGRPFSYLSLKLISIVTSTSTGLSSLVPGRTPLLHRVDSLLVQAIFRVERLRDRHIPDGSVGEDPTTSIVTMP